MKNNKKITGLLFVLLLGVWGSIVYQIIAAVNSDEQKDTESAIQVKVSRNNEMKITFNERVRDPFRYVIKSELPKTVPKQAILWVPPPFRLTGIVVKENQRMAVLEGPDGSAYFVSEGETLNGVKLLKILEKSVTYKYMNQTKDWALAR